MNVYVIFLCAVKYNMYGRGVRIRAIRIVCSEICTLSKRQLPTGNVNFHMGRAVGAVLSVVEFLSWRWSEKLISALPALVDRKVNFKADTDEKNSKVSMCALCRHSCLHAGTSSVKGAMPVIVMSRVKWTWNSRVLSSVQHMYRPLVQWRTKYWGMPK